MKTLEKLKQFFLFSTILLSIALTSCGSDGDEEDDMMQQDGGEAFLDLTVDGTRYEADFTRNNAAILAVTSPNISFTSVTMGGSSTNGETMNFAVVFDAKATGSFNIASGIEGNQNNPEGLTIALVTSSGNTVEAFSYDATNVNVDITSYRGISGVTAEVAGSFSGTIEDDETGNTVSVSGSFSTGSLE